MPAQNNEGASLLLQIATKLSENEKQEQPPLKKPRVSLVQRVPFCKETLDLHFLQDKHMMMDALENDCTMSLNDAFLRASDSFKRRTQGFEHFYNNAVPLSLFAPQFKVCCYHVMLIQLI